MTAPLLTLSMILKDEAATIARTLKSVRPWIDRWVIVDTGSTDATREVVRDTMRGVPGILYSRDFADFATTRNLALYLAGEATPFLLWLDADDLLEDGAELRAALERDPAGSAWHLEARQGAWSWESCRVARTAARWRFVGAVHEVLVGGCGERAAGRVLHEPPDTIAARIRSSRRWARDVELLRAALERDPGDTRSAFYLGMTLLWLGRYEAAAEALWRRVNMGGWSEEIYVARLQLAGCMANLGRAWPQIEGMLLDAVALAPKRAEALALLEEWYRARGEPARAAECGAARLALSAPASGLFVDRRLYSP